MLKVCLFANRFETPGDLSYDKGLIKVMSVQIMIFVKNDNNAARDVLNFYHYETFHRISPWAIMDLS